MSQVGIEELARALHDSGRAAVEAGQTVAHSMLGQPLRHFIEWDDLTDTARDGRRAQALELLSRFDVFYRPKPRVRVGRSGHG